MAGFGNIMNRSNPGERYLMGDLMGPDARFVDDMNLLEGAVKVHAAQNPDNPFVQAQANQFRAFRSRLGWHDCFVIPNETFDQAMVQYLEVERTLGDQFGQESSTLSSIGNWIKGTAGSLVNRSMPGTLYNMGDFLGPDSRFTEDLNAIDDTVRTHARPLIAKYPHSQPLVNDYEQWRQGLGWWELDFKPNETMNEAKAKLAAIKATQGEGHLLTDVAKPGEFVAPPIDTSKPVQKLKTAGKVVAGVAGVILLVLGVRAVKRGAGQAIVAGVKTAASGIASSVKNISTKVLPSKQG